MNLFSPRQVEGWLEGTSLRRSIRGAHLKYTLHSFFMMLFWSMVGSLSLFLGLTVFILIRGVPLIPIGKLDPGIAMILNILILFMLLGPGVFLAIYTYPATTAAGRKNSMNLDLPYTITYMQALSSTMTLYNVIRKVYEAEDLFGEVSKEFGLIVRDVEIFGDDLYTAIRNLQSVTPSKNMEEFLNDLLLLSSSGGDITNFLSSRSAYFREAATRELENVLKTIEIMAEVYVTAFVAGPITMIIIIVAQNLGGKSDLAAYMPMIIIGLALGSIGMIYILYLMLPPMRMDITTKPVEVSDFSDIETNVKEFSHADEKFLKSIEAKRNRYKLENLIKNPFRTYIADYKIGIGIGIVCGIIVSYIYYSGAPATWNISITFEAFLCILLIVVMIPLFIGLRREVMVYQ